jgi:hypothetical protein
MSVQQLDPSASVQRCPLPFDVGDRRKVPRQRQGPAAAIFSRWPVSGGHRFHRSSLSEDHAPIPVQIY